MSCEPILFKRAALLRLPWEVLEPILKELVMLPQDEERFRDPAPVNLRPLEENLRAHNDDSKPSSKSPEEGDFLQAISADVMQIAPSAGIQSYGRYSSRQRRNPHVLPLLYVCRSLHSTAIQTYYNENLWTFSHPEYLWNFVVAVEAHDHLHLVRRVKFSMQLFGAENESTGSAWAGFFEDLEHFDGGLSWFFPGLRKLAFSFEGYYLNPRWLASDTGPCQLRADLNGGPVFDRLIRAIVKNARFSTVTITGLQRWILVELVQRLLMGQTIEYSSALDRPGFESWWKTLKSLHEEESSNNGDNSLTGMLAWQVQGAESSSELYSKFLQSLEVYNEVSDTSVGSSW